MAEKEYRVTWRHEVVFRAEDDKDAREKWQGIHLGYLEDALNPDDTELEGGTPILSHEFVEEVSFECLTDDYREVGRG